MTVKRLNYFKGQFLKAVDFKDEQAYHIEMLRRHNRDQHTWGIAAGLGVSFDVGSSTVTVSAGMAIDKSGRQLVLSADKSVDFSTSAEGVYYLVISYQEEESDLTSETGVEGNTRVTESPLIEAVGSPPGEVSEAILLASVTVNSENKVASVDGADRKYSGVVAADMTARSLKLSIEGVTDDQWPRLSAATVDGKDRLNVAAEEANFSGILSVDGNLGVGVSPLDTLDVNGDLRLRGADIKDAGGTSRITLADNGRLDLKTYGGAVSLSVNTGGNIGIGTTSVTAGMKLDVNGALKVRSTLDIDGDIRLRGADITDAGGTSRITITDNGTLDLKDSGGTSRLTITDNGSLDLKEDGGAVSLTVDTGGNVGIGIAAVTAGMKLDVNGALRVRTNLTVNGDITLGGSDILDAGGTSRIHVLDNGILDLRDSGGTSRLTITDNGVLDLKEGGGGTSLRISTAGYVGIGTSTSYPFHVTKASTNNWQARFTNGAATVHLNHEGGYGMHINTGKTNSSTRYGLEVRNSSGSYLYARDDGRVGIGTTSPSNRLHISGGTTYPLRVSNSNGYMYCGAGNTAHFHFYTDRPSYYFNKPAYAVSGFHTYSTIKLKKDVTYISPGMEDEISESLGKLKLTKFKYRDNSISKRVHLGLIAEDAPLQILSENREAIDLYNYISFSIAAVKSQQRQVKKLQTGAVKVEARINRHEALINRLNKNAGGCDFAEYFKSHNGKAIDTGISVVMEKGKIRAAKGGDKPIGIISAGPSVLGGYHMEWPKKYLKDDFGKDIMEEYKEEILVQETKKVTYERQKIKKKTIEEEVVETVEKKVKGKTVLVEVKKKEKRQVEEPQFKKVDIYDEKGKEVIRTEQVPLMETYEVEEPLYDKNGEPVMIGSGKFEKKSRPKINPDYDPKKEYVTRDQRPEWNIVGLLGQIPLKKGQPTAPSWVKIKDISRDVELWLVK